jgi:hypothetical protein
LHTVINAFSRKLLPLLISPCRRRLVAHALLLIANNKAKFDCQCSFQPQFHLAAIAAATGEQSWSWAAAAGGLFFFQCLVLNPVLLPLLQSFLLLLLLLLHVATITPTQKEVRCQFYTQTTIFPAAAAAAAAAAAGDGPWPWAAAGGWWLRPCQREGWSGG